MDPKDKTASAPLQTMEERDTMRMRLAQSNKARLDAERRAIDAEQRAHDLELTMLQRELAEKYKMVDGDTVDLSSGAITRPS